MCVCVCVLLCVLLRVCLCLVSQPDADSDDENLSVCQYNYSLFPLVPCSFVVVGMVATAVVQHLFFSHLTFFSPSFSLFLSFHKQRQSMMARDGPQGDFATMAKQTSMGNVMGDGNRAHDREDYKEKKANAEGKQCAFCGLRYALKSIETFGIIGSSPKRKRKENGRSSGKSGSQESKVYIKQSTKESMKEDGFTSMVPNFGYTFTERMMLDGNKIFFFFFFFSLSFVVFCFVFDSS